MASFLKEELQQMMLANPVLILVVPNSISGIVSSIDWPENITDQFGKMSGQSDTGTNLLPDLYGFIRIWFQIILFSFSEKDTIFFIHRQGATDYKVHG